MKTILIRLQSLLLSLVILIGCQQQEKENLLTRRSPIQEPYEYISGGSLMGANVQDSPDPLVRYVWDNPKATDPYQIFVMLPQKAEAMENEASFDGLKSVKKEKCRIRVKGTGTIRLDFGTELPAWIEIDSPDLTGEVEIGCSEHKDFSMFKKMAKPVQYGTTYRMELNKELYEGVRYGFIRVNSFDRPFTITSVRAVCQVKPVNYTGSFDCDNPLINRIWYTGAWDVKANLREDSFGAIMFDRGDRFSWTGDAYTAQKAALVAFSCYDEVFKNLCWTDTHPNGIETYELYWVESLIDYFMYSGDEDGLLKLMPRAEERLEHAWQIFDKPTNLTFVGWDHRLGTGFDHPNCQEGVRTFQMLAIGAWKHFAKIMDMIGEKEKAQHYLGLAEAKTRQVDTPEYLNSLGMHSSADAINADLVPDLGRLYHPDLADRLQRQSFSPFNQCFILQAMAHAGHYNHAFASVIDCWGGQIEWGGSCFFEVFRHDWKDIIEKNGPVPFSQAGCTSLAHPWGTAVTSWLSEEMLGIKPLTAGFGSFEVKPHFAGYATSVSGHTMTPHGPIKATFNLNSGRHALTVPEGTEAHLYIPKEGMSVEKFIMNDEPFYDYTEDLDFIKLPPLGPGKYRIEVLYAGVPTEKQQEEYSFATCARVDTITHGLNWSQKYGRDGYYIVCGQEDGEDLSELPEYVEWLMFDGGEGRDVTHSRTKSITPLSEEAVLPVGRESAARKAFGCYYTGGCICNPLKVKLRENRPYEISLYMADCDKGESDVNVEAFDLETGNRISPEVRVPHFEKGAFVTFRYDRSICIYSYNIHGDNAVYNGVFFDSPDE